MIKLEHVKQETKVDVASQIPLAGQTLNLVDAVINDQSAAELGRYVRMLPDVTPTQLKELKGLESRLAGHHTEMAGMLRSEFELDPQAPDYAKCREQLKKKLSDKSLEDLINNLVSDQTRATQLVRDLHTGGGTRDRALEALGREMHLALSDPTATLEIGLIARDDTRLGASFRRRLSDLCAAAIDDLRGIRDLALGVTRSVYRDCLNSSASFESVILDALGGKTGAAGRGPAPKLSEDKIMLALEAAAIVAGLVQKLALMKEKAALRERMVTERDLITKLSTDKSEARLKLTTAGLNHKYDEAGAFSMLLSSVDSNLLQAEQDLESLKKHYEAIAV